ncbi:MAG: putative signal transducing protein [Ruminiclostridium sp.]
MDIDKDNNKEANSEEENLKVNSSNKNDWVYLTTADNDFEYNIIKGKLTENNVVCIGKGRDLDLLDSGFLNIILGPCIAVDIMVPSEMYDEAMQILNLEISDEELEEQAMNSKPEESSDGEL